VTIWDVLGKKHAIEVLFEIYQNPGKIQGEIAFRGNEGSGTRRARLPELENCGLIRHEEVKGSRPTLKYYTTPEGERVCRLLLQIRDGGDPKTDLVLSSSQEDSSVTGKDE